MKGNAEVMAELVKASGSTLEQTVGIGPVTAGRLIGRTGSPSRFPTPAAYTAYTGVAPIEVASGERSRHRLSRSGDRQLNATLHTIAVTQIRTAGSLGNIYYLTKIAERREARRCLKRRLANHIWRTMIADEKRQRAKTSNVADAA